METAGYDTQVEESTAILFEVVVELRRLYPNNQIFFLGYGKVVSVMKERFEADTLPDIAVQKGEGNGALFKDKFGHGGPMVHELAALTWMHTLYGANVSGLTLRGNWDEDSVAYITSRALEYNEQFLAGSNAQSSLGGTSKGDGSTEQGEDTRPSLRTPRPTPESVVIVGGLLALVFFAILYQGQVKPSTQPSLSSHPTILASNNPSSPPSSQPSGQPSVTIGSTIMHSKQNTRHALRRRTSDIDTTDTAGDYREVV